ncbi:hypothetical protein I7I50_02198 [Histoplasma capsulatum G186AR]|uniref:Uncharacterized protein n=1 Tax=Ajellomyces capsulatus TaxID=5037 RepID=A0A8H7YFN9_AJECA|nr:hypothetical protein I7I52_12412 [Histoplasma capsulatum]QSS71384.1 hypothetical protein I7I50_02198 [Histoplasma capsulatum G186AR]
MTTDEVTSLTDKRTSSLIRTGGKQIRRHYSSLRCQTQTIQKNGKVKHRSPWRFHEYSPSFFSRLENKKKKGKKDRNVCSAFYGAFPKNPMLLAGRLANRMTFSNPLFYLKRKGNPRLAPPKSLLFKQGSGLKTDGERDMGVASRARKRWSRPIKIKELEGESLMFLTDTLAGQGKPASSIAHGS